MGAWGVWGGLEMTESNVPTMKTRALTTCVCDAFQQVAKHVRNSQLACTL